MSSRFAYDVFLSFASADMEAATEIWQTLTQGGLRVFWSTETLKETAGQSFLSAIQESLIKSQHFVLFWTARAKASRWVKLEYEAFLNQCHLRDEGSRRLISLLDVGEPISSLPPFLQNLQVTGSAQEVVSLLGGIDPRKLQQENRELRHQMERLREENLALQARQVNLDRQKDPEAEQLKAQLGDARQELALAKQRLEERPASPSRRSYSTLKWDNPKLSPTGDLSLCFRTGEEIEQPLQQYSHDRYTVLRFFLARPTGNAAPIDVTVSFQGKMVYSARAAKSIDNVYITDPIRANTTYRFTVHLDQPQETLSYATIDANTHEIEMVACSVLCCPDGHEWSDTSFKFCPRDGKPLSDSGTHQSPTLQDVAIGKALEKVSAWVSPGTTSVNINWDEVAWRELRREAGTSAETVVRALCLLVREPETLPVQRLKAVVLLGWAIRSPELRAVGEEVLQTFKLYAMKSATGNLSDWQYAGATCARAAVAIADSPLAPQKWRILAEALQDCNCISTVLELLPQITPVNNRLDSVNFVKEALLHSRHKPPAFACVESIRKHGKEAAIPCLRAILRDGDLDDALHAGHVLAEWADIESVPDFRTAIENWLSQKSPKLVDLVESLYSLDESSRAEYIPEILREAPPVVQKAILDRLGTFGDSHALQGVIAELAVTAGNEEIRIAARQALRNAPDGPMTEGFNELS